MDGIRWKQAVLALVHAKNQRSMMSLEKEEREQGEELPPKKRKRSSEDTSSAETTVVATDDITSPRDAERVSGTTSGQETTSVRFQWTFETHDEKGTLWMESMFQMLKKEGEGNGVRVSMQGSIPSNASQDHTLLQRRLEHSGSNLASMACRMDKGKIVPVRGDGSPAGVLDFSPSPHRGFQGTRTETHISSADGAFQLYMPSNAMSPLVRHHSLPESQKKAQIVTRIIERASSQPCGGMSSVDAPIKHKGMGSSSTSKYRGVSCHRLTGRWEASLWVNKRQVYLGGFDSETKAAKAYDLAALKCKGDNAPTNFPRQEYEQELKELAGCSQESLIAKLRRQSSAFSRGKSRFRGVSGHKATQNFARPWEARIGSFFGRKNVFLGLYESEEEAAKQYDRALIISKGKTAKTNFPIETYEKEAQEYRSMVDSEKGPARVTADLDLNLSLVSAMAQDNSSQSLSSGSQPSSVEDLVRRKGLGSKVPELREAMSLALGK